MTIMMEGKVALITGAGSGIGRAVARVFAQGGARVVLADRDAKGLMQTRGLVEERGGEVLTVAMDVTKAEEVKGMVDKTVNAFGRLDYAVNNAGIGGVTAMTPDYPQEVWDKVMAVNLTGVWLCMKHQIPVMLDHGGGVIINVSSAAGLNGFARHSAYAAAKHGVVGLSKSAALEYAKRGIRINAVCPAFTQTPLVDQVKQSDPKLGEALTRLIPAGRLGSTEEIARTIAFLCSDGAGFITGIALPIDGGMTAM